MAYQLPTIPDFKGQFLRDFPFSTPLVQTGVVGAQATASLNNGGSVSAIAVDSGGSGYSSTQPPDVIVYGGGGVGASASLTIIAGAVSAIAVVNGGYGFRTAPYVYVTLGGDNTDLKKVTDYDIAKAFNTAVQFNTTEALYGSQAAYTLAINLLAAHYLCENIAAGSVGLGGQADWLTKAKDVGNVAQHFEIPARVLNSPYLSKLSKTTYGAQFLELVSPQLIGNMASFHRRTLP